MWIEPEIMPIYNLIIEDVYIHFGCTGFTFFGCGLARLSGLEVYREANIGFYQSIRARNTLALCYAYPSCRPKGDKG
jgi:hypothetical protein